jgi:hypothetical protein
MGIKFSVGVSDGHEDREQLEELRRKSPAGQRGRGEKTREPKAAGWPLQASGEDESIAGQSLWAW